MIVMCIVPVAPLRAEASHRAEMVTQLLFGELCTELEHSGDFVKVKCDYDDYEGWCQKTQLAEYTGKDYSTVISPVYTREAVIQVNNADMIIPFGSFIQTEAGGQYPVSGYRIDASGLNQKKASSITDAEQLLQYTQLFMNTAYLWGGKSVWGVDCSGFVQQVYKAIGIKLPRDAYQQAEIGELVGFLQEARPGDLAFFDNEEGRITHVGIMLNNHSIMHASGNVHIDQIDNAGILHHITGKRTHKLRLIKRVLM